jgi:hypothetical protein
MRSDVRAARSSANAAPMRISMAAASCAGVGGSIRTSGPVATMTRVIPA